MKNIKKMFKEREKKTYFFSLITKKGVIYNKQIKRNSCATLTSQIFLFRVIYIKNFGR